MTIRAWAREAARTLRTAAGETCRIWIGGVRHQGQFWLYRDVADLPIEYQQIFGEAGDYRVLIQVDADDAAPVQMILRVVAAEGEKTPNAIQRGRVEVALLADDSPAFDWAFVGAVAPAPGSEWRTT